MKFGTKPLLGGKMDEKTFIEIFSKVVRREPDTIDLDGKLDDYLWDSLASMEFISVVDELAGLSVDSDRMFAAVNVKDLLNSVIV